MFKKILIANRGEIAARVARSCRRLGVETVGVHSEADADALHPTTVDASELIGPASVKESYLNVEAVLAAAKKHGVEAIHPGYGLLSEKSQFARAVQAAGLVWIGPPPEALDLLGDKLKSRRTAHEAGVSPVPGTDGPIATLEEAREAVAQVGFPALIKAVGGGGGIGMQVVRDEGGIERALKSCADRGAQAFGDSRVYIERYVENPRHIEVQIFGDTQGNVIALGERECSLQRRHQKIVEESPAPAFALSSDGARFRREILDAAVRIAKVAGYVGAGTCEFIWDSSREEFYFLEMNCRIQVEHPVTEMVFGVDLVEQQLRVACGEALAPEVLGATSRGHAIEARIYAEDPAKGFIPKPGDIAELSWPVGADVRVDAGVRAPGRVTPFYDPMIAKVIARGATREEAIDRLHAALSDTLVSPLVTNLAFLRSALRSEEFSSGRYHTGFAEVFAKRK